MTTGAVDLPVQPTHAAVETLKPGTDRPPGKSDLGIALFFIAPAMIGFSSSTCSRPSAASTSASPSTTSWDPADRPRELHQAVPGPAVLELLAVTVQYVVLNIGSRPSWPSGLALLMHRVAKSTSSAAPSCCRS